ncbi:MAG: cation diffusion facilitator family transporter [Candidatus Buchananbacteria bacterium]
MSNQKKQSVALSSVFASLVLTLGKLVVGLLTGSMGILSEAAHSLLDLGAAILTYFTVRVSDKPADSKHPFGHGKAESVSALIETGLLFLTSAWIIFEAVKRLIFKSVEVEATWYAFAVIIISILIDISRSRALYKVAKETKSQALEADALHFSSDIWSSGVVLIGLGFVAFGLNGADAIAALIVAIFVLVAGYRLGKRTIDVLIDTAPQGTTERIYELVEQVDGVLNIEKLRVRPAGASLFIDMLININRKLPQIKVDQIIKNVCATIKENFAEADILVSTQAKALDSETVVEKVQLVAAKHDVFVHDISVHILNGKTDISFDLELNHEFSLKQAHDLSSVLEDEIKMELSEDVIINTHIEPADIKTLVSLPVDDKTEKEVNQVFSQIGKKIAELKNIHEIQIKKVGSKLFITVHCCLDGKTSLETAHDIASRIEYLAKEKISEIARVVVHSEPDK